MRLDDEVTPIHNIPCKGPTYHGEECVKHMHMEYILAAGGVRGSSARVSRKRI